MLTRFYSTRRLIPLLGLLAFCGLARAADNPFLGAWELTLPGPAAGWLGVEETGGRLQASIMWVAGSVLPVASAKIEDDKLILTRHHEVEHKDAAGKTVKGTITETITATVSGDQLQGVSLKPRDNGQGEERTEFTGKRSPPMPPAPDLSKLQFGPPVTLFNGKDLTGWRLTDPNAVNGWSVKDGILVNRHVQEKGEPHKNFGNLRTDQEFEDFNLTLDVRYPKDGNSGIYLRGIYEVQVEDNYGKSATTHSIGSIYSRIRPTSNPCKPAGQWQHFDITFVDRHVTVKLNGVTVVNNQPVEGCTGGALWSDVTRPGPIYLQGDHTSVEYRNIELRPVIK
jgi:3-keto-disaccharide hydrolase